MKPREEVLLDNFLSSAFFAEDDAAPVVARLLEHPFAPDERAALVAYGAEEERHAELLDALLRRKGIPRGAPFVIQRFFHVLRSRAALLAQTYHVELMAGVFYGAVAGATKDPDTKAVLQRILLDEAKHIRLHRELFRRAVARQGPLGRLASRALAFVLRSTVHVTSWLQARQLRPLVGERARELPGRVHRHLLADRERIFAAGRESAPKSLAPSGLCPVALSAPHD